MSNLFEKACNDVNDKLIISTVAPVLSGAAMVVPSISTADTVSNIGKNTYKIFGYELSMATIAIIVICLVVVVYLIYSYFFKTKTNIVNMKKFELTDTDTEKDEDNDNTNEDIQDEDIQDEDNLEK